jgi:hypothetical protein
VTTGVLTSGSLAADHACADADLTDVDAELERFTADALWDAPSGLSLTA